MVDFVALMLCVFGAMLLRTSATITDTTIVVSTEYGDVLGISTPISRVFMGIPYATPPLGILRWQSPQPVQPWTPATLNATQYKPACIQVCDAPGGACPATFAEDCLYLNIWTPLTASPTELKPVMVFIPGGRFVDEGASTNFYWGKYLSNQTNVVVVTLNYRLGVLGWLVSDQVSGNFGLQDQRTALQWVQSNIRNFGGDNKQVTLFGQSAGADSVLLHLVSPPSQNQGLFHRVLLESATIGIPFWDVETQYKFSAAFVRHLGCKVDDFACLLNATSSEILAAQLATTEDAWPNTFQKSFQWSPFVGTSEIPLQPLDAIISGLFEKVPILLGSTRDEGVTFIYSLFSSPVSATTYKADLLGIFGIHGDKVLQYYPLPHNTTDARPTMSVIATHKVWACASRFLANSLSAQMDFPVYLYFWDHPFSFNPWGNFTACVNMCCHGEELPFVFNTPTIFNFSFTDEETILQNQISTLWGYFAYGSEGSMPISNTAWPVYNILTNASLRFDTGKLQVETNRLAEYCELWDEIGYDFGTSGIGRWGIGRPW